MAIDIMRFVLNRTIIERRGAPAEDAGRLALVPSVLNVPLGVSAAIATVVGDRARPAPPPATGETPSSGTGTVKIPRLRGSSIEDAAARLDKLGLRPAFGIAEEGQEGKVSATVPAEGTAVPAGSHVILLVPNGPGGPAPTEHPPPVSGGPR